MKKCEKLFGNSDSEEVRDSDFKNTFPEFSISPSGSYLVNRVGDSVGELSKVFYHFSPVGISLEQETLEVILN